MPPSDRRRRTHPLTIVGGRVIAPRPGLGVIVEEDKLAHYRGGGGASFRANTMHCYATQRAACAGRSRAGRNTNE